MAQPIDTSSIKMNTAQIKSALKNDMQLPDLIKFGGKTDQDLQNIVVAFELKYERIQLILNDPAVSEADKQNLRDKITRIILQYFLIKKWLSGVRP